MTHRLQYIVRRIACPAFIVIALTLASCAHAPVDAKPGLAYTAVASWYGPGFHGRRTASGEVFDQEGLTAAHRTFPFGTRLKVTNPKTTRSVCVVVNDRGPFVAGREIDLSKGAAFAIGALSTCLVQIEVLDRDLSYVKCVNTGPLAKTGLYRVQVGSFLDPLNAEHLKQGLDIGYDEVRITKAVVNGRSFNRVQVGSFKDGDEAKNTARRLADEGYNTLIVRE
jgi:rare lipoprotein A